MVYVHTGLRGKHLRALLGTFGLLCLLVATVTAHSPILKHNKPYFLVYAAAQGVIDASSGINDACGCANVLG